MKTLRKFYQTAVTPAVTNMDYEGEIKQAGDRVNILSFLSDVTLSDYVANTDMTTETIVDAQDQLVVEKRKYYNFPIDRLEDLFTYADDVNDTLTENGAKVMEREIDRYVLANATFAKAGSWVGTNLRFVASAGDTQASIATSATGGSVLIQVGGSGGAGTNNVATYENPVDGVNYFTGFTAADINKPIRLTSGTSWATEWYRITSITSSIEVAVVNWDGAISGSDIPNGDVLRGLFGGSDYTGDLNGDGKPTTQEGWGWELQAAIATTLTNSTIYSAIAEVASKLNQNEVPDTERHITVTPAIYQVLQRASELNPAIAMAYDAIVINGKVGKVLGFDIHMAAGTRLSTRVGHSQSSGLGADVVLTNGALGTQVLANHISFCTFAYKWAESRVVDSENQFAKKYQGLHLFGALVPAARRKAGSVLFAAANI